MTSAVLPLSAARRIASHEMHNVGRSRWLLAYAAFFLLASDALLRFGGADDRAFLSLASVVLFVAPLVGLVFGTTYLYASRESTELLLAQPVGRAPIFLGLYFGLALPLALALALGLALPFAWHGIDMRGRGTLLLLVGCGVALTLTFVALAFMVALRADDRVRGLGVAIGWWLVLALLYDGAILVGIALFSQYAIERAVLALILANPIDLARIVLLLRFDAGALQGYTGAVFAGFFGGQGVIVAIMALALWIAAPVALGFRAFCRRDF